MGGGIWSDGKDKSDGSQAHTWNVEVLIDVVKEVVSLVYRYQNYSGTSLSCISSSAVLSSEPQSEFQRGDL